LTCLKYDLEIGLTFIDLKIFYAFTDAKQTVDCEFINFLDLIYSILSFLISVLSRFTSIDYTEESTTIPNLQTALTLIPIVKKLIPV
jgi:hypothetical protein